MAKGLQVALKCYRVLCILPNRRNVSFGLEENFREEMVTSLSNDDGDGNENGKKAIGLDWQNNNFVRASLFLYISLPSLHDYNVKMPKFTPPPPKAKAGTQDSHFLFLFLNFDTVLQNSTLKKIANV